MDKTVDLSEIFSPVDNKTTVTLKIKDMTFVIRPITTREYFDFDLKEKNGDEEAKFLARIEMLKMCLIDPKVTTEEIMEMPHGLSTLLFNKILELSFLQPKL